MFLYGSLLQASNTPTQLPVEKKKKSIGHFIFTQGCFVPMNASHKVLGLAGIGYQTKIWETFPIHSIFIDLQSACNLDIAPGTNSSALNLVGNAILPKVSCIRYLNPLDDNRFFFEVGGALSLFGTISCIYDNEEEHEQKELKPILSDATSPYLLRGIGGYSIGALFGFGIEFGPASESICRLAVQYVQPLEHYEWFIAANRDLKDAVTEEVPSNNYQMKYGALTATFGVGF